MYPTKRFAILASCFLYLASCNLAKAELRLAIAANFKGAAEAILVAYSHDSQEQIQRSYGASGKLASQILNGATYDVFLSADEITHPKLQAYIINGTKQTYAYGKLALWSANARKNNGTYSGTPLSLEQFRNTQIDCLAMANPKLAPYGKAAQEAFVVLESNGLEVAKIVTGQSVAHAFGFVASGSCAWGMIAQAQLVALGKPSEGILVPHSYYTPIKQNAVLLKHGEHNAAAKNFLDFLKSKQAQDIIREFGYDLPQPSF
jgi:molybdate transport system substrate-binding protein